MPDVWWQPYDEVLGKAIRASARMLYGTRRPARKQAPARGRGAVAARDGPLGRRALSAVTIKTLRPSAVTSTRGLRAANWCQMRRAYVLVVVGDNCGAAIGTCRAIDDCRSRSPTRALASAAKLDQQLAGAGQQLAVGAEDRGAALDFGRRGRRPADHDMRSLRPEARPALRSQPASTGSPDSCRNAAEPVGQSSTAQGSSGAMVPLVHGRGPASDVHGPPTTTSRPPTCSARSVHPSGYHRLGTADDAAGIGASRHDVAAIASPDGNASGTGGSSSSVRELAQHVSARQLAIHTSAPQARARDGGGTTHADRSSPSNRASARRSSRRGRRRPWRGCVVTMRPRRSPDRTALRFSRVDEA